MQINIRDLMENIEDSSVQLEEKDVVSSEKIKELTKMKINEYGNTQAQTAKRSSKKLVTVIVAAAVVSALGLSAYAAFKGGLEGVAFGGGTEVTGTASSDVSASQNVMISLQGYSDSNEYKAAQEWHLFEDNYDPDGKLLDEADKRIKSLGHDPYEKYEGICVYTDEMASKVDEIVAKYNLKLHGKCHEADADKLIETYGNIFTDITGGGYYYEDGTFHLDAEYNGMFFQIRRCVDGVFDDVYINVGDINDYEQWVYVAKDGTEVSIAKSDDNNVLIAKTPKGFVVINCQPEDENLDPIAPFTKAQLEDLADHICFKNL